jgi:hypothetical protein
MEVSFAGKEGMFPMGKGNDNYHYRQRAHHQRHQVCQWHSCSNGNTDAISAHHESLRSINSGDNLRVCSIGKEGRMHEFRFCRTYGPVRALQKNLQG